MRKNSVSSVFVTLIAIVLLSGFAGCSQKEGDYYSEVPGGAPRLVVSGTVRAGTGEALSGIRVAVYGVREETEQDIPSYNYALTDAKGHYEIIRYRGRELPAEVTLLATDPEGLYKEQYRSVTVRYDSVYTNDRRKEPYNGFATADFILQKQ